MKSKRPLIVTIGILVTFCPWLACGILGTYIEGTHLNPELASQSVQEGECAGGLLIPDSDSVIIDGTLVAAVTDFSQNYDWSHSDSNRHWFVSISASGEFAYFYLNGVNNWPRGEWNQASEFTPPKFSQRVLLLNDQSGDVLSFETPRITGRQTNQDFQVCLSNSHDGSLETYWRPDPERR